MTAWLQQWSPPVPGGTARARVLCLPYAGGGAGSYREWGPAMPSRRRFTAPLAVSTYARGAEDIARLEKVVRFFGAR